MEFKLKQKTFLRLAILAALAGNSVGVKSNGITVPTNTNIHVDGSLLGTTNHVITGSNGTFTLNGGYSSIDGQLTHAAVVNNANLFLVYLHLNWFKAILLYLVVVHVLLRVEARHKLSTMCLLRIQVR